MRGWVVPVVLALGIGAGIADVAESAEAPTREVRMPGRAFDPSRLDVLVGTTVVWRNDDSLNHTATSSDDTFASGYIPPGGSFSFTFDKQGRYAFKCTIHKFMQGAVNVFGLVLTGPEGAVRTGRRVVLAGLAPPGATEVNVRGGETVQAVRTRPDGSFAFGIVVSAPVTLRAVAGRLSSPPVRVLVKPIVRLRRSGLMLHATTAPARPGATALLQVYDRERFDWVVRARARLDASSRAHFSLPTGIERARVLVRGSQGWADAASPSLVGTGDASAGRSSHIGSH